jgi:hypothetical protein
VWISPFTNELSEDALIALLADCADRAERLRASGADVVMVAGAELSLFTPGLLPGEGPIERINAIMMADANRRREIVVPMRQRLNELLARAVAEIRQRFGGKITYAAIPFEGVDWAPFDFASIDCYRMTAIAAFFRPGIREFVAKGKPVAITEFGCATFHGASERGAQGGAIVDYENGREKQLNGEYLRDEDEQAREIVDLLTRIWIWPATAWSKCSTMRTALPIPACRGSRKPRLPLSPMRIASRDRGKVCACFLRSPGW